MGLLRIDPGCQTICDLPDDLLLQILLLVPTKDALATAILSKRWRHVPKMLPELIFKDDQGNESLGLFIDEYLQLHKAPKLLSLVVELGPQCRRHVDLDVRKWVEKAVIYGVRKLDFKLLWTSKPTSFYKSLYTCGTLKSLTLSEKVLVDVSFPASLPFLLYLGLFNVMYKDEDSLARLLSSSPILEKLVVRRHENASLKFLSYRNQWREGGDFRGGSLVIDSPALTDLRISDFCGGYCSLLENMPCLDKVLIGYVPNHDAKFLPCLSSARHLLLSVFESMVTFYNVVKFSRLIDLFFVIQDGENWLESLICFLKNSPTLKTLVIITMADPPSSWNWNQPNTIPQCLSSHLEILRCKNYEGNEGEKQVLTYILANSKCLKTVEISLKVNCNIEECQKELESMPRISPSSRLLYSTPQANWKF